jgi:hypothetical protein
MILLKLLFRYYQLIIAKQSKKYSARFETIKNVFLWRVQNVAAELFKQSFYCTFSAHSFPVSPDFFTVIRINFNDPYLAGLRCVCMHQMIIKLYTRN